MNKKSITHSQQLPEKILRALGKYIRTQFILSLVVFLVTWAVLGLLKVEFAVILALVSGAVSVVPFWGTLVSALLATLVAIFDSSRFLPGLHPVVEGIAVFGVYMLLNIVVDFFLSPYLNAKMINVPAPLLLLLIIIATSLFGLLGALLTVPAILVVKTILEHQESLASKSRE
jgi:predicted PurR-regulated permease PerM